MLVGSSLSLTRLPGRIRNFSESMVMVSLFFVEAGSSDEAFFRLDAGQVALRFFCCTGRWRGLDVRRRIGEGFEAIR